MAKRFYKNVNIDKTGDGFVVKLDGRVLKTPGKLDLILPDRKTAQLIAAEWDAQDGEIVPVSMPCTRLVNVAIEHAASRRDDLVKEARAYAGTDLLSYRKNDPEEFRRLQDEKWNPVLKWAARQGVALQTTDRLVAIAQNEKSLDNVAAYARGLDDIHLTLFVHLTAVFGSAILALAVMKKHLGGAEAFRLSRLDEDWQNKHWGEDEEAKARTEALAIEVEALCKLLD